MKLILDDATEFLIPPTMYLEDINKGRNFKEERAPFSSNVVVSGDGLRVAGPYVLSGKVYAADDDAAMTWIYDARDAVQRAVSFVGDIQVTSTGDLWEISVFSGDITIVPTLLPRILNVKIRLFPKSTSLVTDWGA